MCGIVGAIAERNVTEIILDGLKKLEYRGYDSAGIAVVDSGEMRRLRALGKVKELESRIRETKDFRGNIGIGHTRWATHGGVTAKNTHPHTSGSLVMVHNGIIENYRELKEELLACGYVFESETDTECFLHLIHRYFVECKSLLKAVRDARKKVQGAYAIAIFDSENPDCMIGLRSGCPLVLGLGFGENLLASDQLAIWGVTRKLIFLEDGDLATLTKDEIQIYDCNDQCVERAITEISANREESEKGKYKHFMEKEIHEQPRILAELVERNLSQDGDHLLHQYGPRAREEFSQIDSIQIIGCGTSYNSALVAKYWIEDLLRICCQVDIASEFRYRNFVVPKNTLFVTLSQSGETADTLAALRIAKKQSGEAYLGFLSICNVPNSSLMRESSRNFLMEAGVEMSVASTKAFTAQLTSLLLLTAAIAEAKQCEGIYSKIKNQLFKMPQLITTILSQTEEIEKLASDFAGKHNALYLGRGSQFPIALEGALKLKEISYIHAEAYAAGELKHGPLALVDDQMPVVVVAPNNELLEKLHSNIEEVKARGGLFYIFADETLVLKYQEDFQAVFIPSVDDLIAPIIYSIPLQLLSYFIAVVKGTDVDQPRNLAKSVTVE